MRNTVWRNKDQYNTEEVPTQNGIPYGGLNRDSYTM